MFRVWALGCAEFCTCLPRQYTIMNLQYCIQLPHPANTPAYPSNYVSTTKYSLLTFLPLALILQFRRYANIYFLACAILQSIPLLSPLSPLSAILPLVFVLTLSMLRQGFEDYKRWRSDKQSNASVTHMFQGNNLVNVPWLSLRPGNVVKVHREQLMPVDMIALYCAEGSGIGYVETSSLDGEKNLKPKIALPETQLSFNEKKQHFLSDIKVKLVCDQPNADINRFNGKLELSYLDKQVKCEVNHKNFMLRGTKLKNTDWMVGLTVYTGNQTKIMMNGCGATFKTSNIQRKVNRIILLVILFELLCCAGSTLYCYFSCMATQDFEDLVHGGAENANCSVVSGIAFASYFILYSTFIPISLIVSLQFVKVFQGYAMSTDKQMFCALNGRSMQCHNVSINQELGQIEYILTDKTGTLTRNKMQFKNIIVGKSVYGQDIKLGEISKEFDFGKLSRRYSKLDIRVGKEKEKGFDSRGLDYDLSMEDESIEDRRAVTYNYDKFKEMNGQVGRSQSGIGTSHKKEIQLAFFMITTCHECLRQNKAPSKIPKNVMQQQQEDNQMEQSSYQGPSPDEVALLNAAKKIGFEFINTQNKVTTVLYHGKQYKFKILRIIEFDSDRKRMTVVVDWQGAIMTFVKGADTSIRKLLSPNQKYLDYITQKTKQMARTGLRSLWFAYKLLPTNGNYREMPLQQIQRDLTLIGATGIEDRLQDYVPETIFSLKQGGIKFVMLTGDKLQTAQNIARSCKMIEQGFLISSTSELKQGIKVIRQQRASTFTSICPVIDGSALNFAANQDQLLQIISISQSAVFCRVTPNQKAQIVRIVKKLGKLTLAIGDGANDVNMILQAHVGVGIFGEEGTRAAQVSNFAIGEFCLLWKLLLYYGRLNYMRISEMILYFFYKNMVFTIVQFAYSFYNLGSGQSFWLSWSITLYNMIFTLIPVMIRAVFEVDVNVESDKNTLKKISQKTHQDELLYSYYPKMYLISQQNQTFTTLIFFQWFFLGVLQGILCLMITLYSLDGPTNTSGYSAFETGLYCAQLTAYTSVIVVVTIKLAINVRNWNLILVIGFLIPSFGAYFVFCVLQNYVSISDTQYMWNQLLTMPSFYMASILTILGMFAVDMLLFSIQSTRSNFQNYFKKKALTGKRMTEANLQELINKLEKKSMLTQLTE